MKRDHRRIILIGIFSFDDYQRKLTNLDVCRTCPECKVNNTLQAHGSYPRKSDRYNCPELSFNMVRILRFLCILCHKTFSALPEFIAPRRWYLWCIQSIVIKARLTGHTWKPISKITKVSIDTCKRWFKKLQAQFPYHRDALVNLGGNLGNNLAKFSTLQSFWQQCLNNITLDRAMLICYRAKTPIT